MGSQIFGCYGKCSEEIAREMGLFYPRHPVYYSIGDLTVGYYIDDGQGNPISDHYFEDENVLVVFDGEIFPLPPESPVTGQGLARIAADAYNKYGSDFTAWIDGFFSCLIYDKRKKKALFLCDRTGGIRTGYYSLLPDCFCFASQIKPLLKIRTPEINENALYTFLRMGYVVLPHTFFAGIFQVIPGEGMVVTDQGHQRVQLRNRVLPDYTVHGTRRTAYMDTIRAAVKDRVITSKDKKIIIMLSGGVDSACIAAFAKDYIPDLETVTLDAGNENNKDAYYASKVADFLSIKNHKYSINSECLMELPRIIWHAESPVTSLLYYNIATHAKKHGDVVLGGSGNDGIYGTFSFHLDNVQRDGSRMLRLLKPLQKHIPGGKLPGICVDMYTKWKPLQSMHKTIPGSEIPGMYVDIYTKWRHEEISQATCIDSDTQLTSTLTDINGLMSATENVYDRFMFLDEMLFSYNFRTMLGKNVIDACSLALREPFMDRAVESIVLSLPHDLKNRTIGGENIRKYFFKKYVAEQLLPKDVVYRKKESQGMPVTAWLRDIPGIKEAVIRKLKCDDAFNTEKIVHILNSTSDLQSTRLLCPLTNYCVWKEIFISSETPTDPTRDLFYYLN